MKIRALLLAGAVFPFALSYPAAALDGAAFAPGLLLAQAEPECPEGTECPPTEEGAETPAAEGTEEPAAEGTEEPAAEGTEEPAAEGTEEPAAEATEEPQAEEGQTQQDRRQQRRERRERRQQEQQQQGEQQQQEQPAEQTETTVEEPAAEQAPAEEAQPEGQSREERRQQRRERRQRQQQQEQTGAEQPEAEGTNPQGVLERARRRQQQLQQGEQPAEEPPVEAAEDTAPEGESTVEKQLEAQGDDAEADQVRDLRRKLRRARQEAEQPSEAAEEKETAEERDRRDGPDERERGRVVERRGDRIIIDLGGGQVRVEPVTRDESERLLFGASDVEVERLPNGRTRTIVYRDNGSEIITTRDRYGNIIRRIRRSPDGREYVLIDNRFPEGPRPIILLQPLPPPVITIPRDQYIVDLGRASPRQIQQALLAPPVQELDQSYTLEEVVSNESIRAYLPRIDLDTITFDFGSATIGEDQMPALESLGVAMEDVIFDNPSEVYLIEGHTDAVGSDYDNLRLSDRRAEAVAVALSQNFDIPPENLVTEGYGEQYLKVETEAPERANRRVTVRRLTPLLQTSEAEQ
jgi:outer membrane protein OmpA-like peptidoglycan-associated protein